MRHDISFLYNLLNLHSYITQKNRVMSRLEESGWSPYEEFKETKKTVKRSPQIKTLTRATKKNIEQVKLNILQQLPVLTSTGIRRYRLPHHECVLLELKELGMPGVAEYIEKLYQIDEKINNEKSLKFQNILIDRLKNCLMDAEIANRKCLHLEETTTLFETAVFFQSLSNQWFWIVQELLQKALTSAAMICSDNGLTINLVKFFYGKFLFHRMKDDEEALNYLREVREASEGRNWNGSKFLKIKQDNLYRESNILLFEIHHSKAEKFRNINPKIAVKLSFEALKCANDSEDEKYIARGLYELGKCQMAAEDVTGALKIFAKFLAKVKRIPDYESICNAHKELAMARQRLKDDDGIRKHLILFRECASEHELPDKLAEAHYLTGKYLLECDLPTDASPHLRIAFDLYKNLGIAKEMDKSRYLLGISKGEEVLEEFMKLVLDCGSKDKEATSKLLEWKNKRVPFWSSPNEKTTDIEVECMNSEAESVLFTNSSSSLEKDSDESNEQSLQKIT